MFFDAYLVTQKVTQKGLRIFVITMLQNIEPI